MKLNTFAGLELQDPTGQDIERALGALTITGEYDAVISADDDHFIQARGEVKEEWADGATDGLMLHALDGSRHMFESLQRHPPPKVIRLFQLYAQGNPQWKREIEWREYRPAGPTLFIIGGILLGIFILWRLVR